MGGGASFCDAPFWLGRERIELAEAEVARRFAADFPHSVRGTSSVWPAAPSFYDGTKRGEPIPDCRVRSRSRATWLVRASIFRRSPPRPLTRGAGLVQSAYRCPARATASQASFDVTRAHPPFRSPVARSSELTKQNNSGLPAPNLSDHSRQWIADGQRRPRIGSPSRVHALNHRAAAEFPFEPAR
jgi:hypothetical protein